MKKDTTQDALDRALTDLYQADIPESFRASWRGLGEAYLMVTAAEANIAYVQQRFHLRGIRIGEDHQNARYSNAEVEMVLTLRDEGMSYGQIKAKLDMPKSTVASICNARRRCQIAAAFKKIIVGG